MIFIKLIEFVNKNFNDPIIKAARKQGVQFMDCWGKHSSCGEIGFKSGIHIPILTK